MFDALLGLTTTFTNGGWCTEFKYGDLGSGLDGFAGWGGAGGSLAQFSTEKNAVFSFTVTGIAPAILGDFRTYDWIIPSFPKNFLSLKIE